MSTSDIVVITGASSGIGRTTARMLAARGARLVLVARSRTALEEVASECRSMGTQAQTHAADVTDHEAMLEVANETVATFGRLDAWVNAAAVASYGRLTDLPIEEVCRVLDVNVMGYVNGCRAAANAMGDRAAVIVNVASIVGKVPQPYTAPYDMSKAAVLALGASMRSELALDGRKLHVVRIVPPTIDTPFFGHAGNHVDRELVALPPVYPPEAVARRIVEAIRHPRKQERVVGMFGRALVLLHRVTPRLTEGMMAFQTVWGQFGRSGAPRSSGTLFVATERDDATGGWHGARRRNVRVVLGIAALAAFAMTLRRTRVSFR
ncbi:SDR family NAD(P)-dependent oxidoreductase [Rathayibacter sp. KR2-224]|uniref:SDR family NAD(P)-dependent oxidoreductase n=1 Tax=Rathayibacter sp. KR2-224 TaxID=3400913 RepID=UPI003BFFF270